MNSRTVERVRSWQTVSVGDGYRGLHDLADDGFSGAVVADDTWLFMLNGRVVGVFEGRIEDFEDASPTAYDAPHMSLPLLFTMEESGGQTQATYYTNDTPLSETDETLSDAGFTGYIELSENVLSGDYYTVYYGGRSMSAAFVGSSEELVSGEEAFERADDEVGLYEVVKVDIDVTDVPEPAEESDPEPDPETAAAGAAAAETTDDDAESEPEPEPQPEPETPDSTEESVVAEAEPDRETEPEPASDPEPAVDSEPTAESTADSEPAAETESVAASDSEADAEPEPGVRRPEAEHVEQSPSARSVPDAESRNVRAEAAGDDTKFSQEEAWRKTTTVPSLDPEEASGQAAVSKQAAKKQAAKKQAAKKQAKPKKQSAETSTRSSRGQSQERAKTPEVVEKLEAAVEERDERIDELESRVEEAESETEELRAELTELREERDALREEVESLTADLEAAREAAPAAGPNDRSPEDALSGTNLFVRYDSKADPTLDDVLNGDATPETVNANLRLEHHTQFDASAVTVDGEPFESFLENTAAYRFVSWAVRELPYELLDTGKQGDLAEVFDSIPDIDRAELHGAVSVRDEDGEEERSSFDVVLRDRMGNPLVVAELNPERDPVTGSEMAELVESAETIAEAQESLGGAFYVTASFFEPNALETAKDSTGGGGFLSRSDKASFVKVARKSGFHLCLVEDRKGSFHVTVPEL